MVSVISVSVWAFEGVNDESFETTIEKTDTDRTSSPSSVVRRIVHPTRKQMTADDNRAHSSWDVEDPHSIAAENSKPGDSSIRPSPTT